MEQEQQINKQKNYKGEIMAGKGGSFWLIIGIEGIGGAVHSQWRSPTINIRVPLNFFLGCRVVTCINMRRKKKYFFRSAM